MAPHVKGTQKGPNLAKLPYELMSLSLNPLKGGYIGDYIGDYEKLSALDGPAPRSIYDKGGFQGKIFAEISSHEDCDLVVALLRSAGINQGDTRFGPHKTDHQWKELLAISALD